MIRDFKAFLLRGNLVELATAFVMGIAFSAVVTAAVDGIVNPLIALIVGKADFSQLAFTIRDTTFPYGLFVGAVVNFVAVAAVVFFLIVKPTNRLVELMGTAGTDTPSPATRQCPECLTEIPADARRCSACTSPVPVA